MRFQGRICTILLAIFYIFCNVACINGLNIKQLEQPQTRRQNILKHEATKFTRDTISSAVVAMAAANKAKAANSLVLFLGSSIDLNAIKTTCQAAGQVFVYTPGTEVITSMPYYHYLAHCIVQGVILVFIFQPGAGAPPYYSFYTQNGGNTSSQDIVTQSVANVRQAFGREPSSIVVDANLWDSAAWWQHSGMPPVPYPVPQKEIAQWCQHDVPHFLDWVQAAYPSSKVAFRTTPTVLGDGGFGQQPATLDAMRQCIVKNTDVATGKLYKKYGMIDYYSLAVPLDPKLYVDALHPGAWLSAKYMTRVLDWARKTK